MNGAKTSAHRLSPRIYSVKEIAVRYEGERGEITIRRPNVSACGMFLSTDRWFPEGAVLNLSFRLALSGVEVCARGEARYCTPGIGAGVEFVDISAEALRSIEREIRITGILVRISQLYKGASARGRMKRGRTTEGGAGRSAVHKGGRMANAGSSDWSGGGSQVIQISRRDKRPFRVRITCASPFPNV
jgi:PilZ domain